MAQQIPIDRPERLDEITADDGTHPLSRDLAYRRLGIVNVVCCGMPGGEWVLIDTGGTRALITDIATRRFARAPSAIVLTHAHFDHAGEMEALLRHWDVPVYAHPLERPYLDGSASYPPPDPGVGGGLMAALSPLYPAGPYNAGDHLRMLPDDGSVPFMPGWQWIHTPGHAPGHVSLWRERDRALIAGDAFVTTAQESAYAAFSISQPAEIHGPPKYFTIDFEATHESVCRLSSLGPETVVTGHGPALRGEAMRSALREPADRFDDVAVPRDGKYVLTPARAGDGSAYRSAR